MVRCLALVVLLAACRGSSAPPPPAHKDAAAAVAVVIDAGPPPVDARLTPDERCPDPCRFLDEVALDEIGAFTQGACNAPWPEVAGCDELDRLRSCVYAVHGFPFPKGKGRDAFAKAAWYAKRADFKDSDLGAVASANVVALEQRAKECRAGIMVSAVDRARVVDFFATIAKGRPAMPPEVQSNHPGIKPTELRRIMTAHRDTTYRLRPSTPISYQAAPEELKSALKAKRFHVVKVDLSGCAGLSPEQCDDQLWLDLAFDDDSGALLALRHGAKN